MCFFSPFLSFNYEEARLKHCYNKIWICQISCDFFSFSTRCDYVIPPDELVIINDKTESFYNFHTRSQTALRTTLA